MLTVDAAKAIQLPPRVTDYKDYHDFLRDFFVQKKSQSPRFSYRRFAALSGIKSSNFLLLVMKKKRRLSPDMAKAVGKAMKLDRAELDYFLALVRLEHSKTDEEWAEIEKSRKMALGKIAKQVLPLEKAEYLSVWYYPLIRELAFLPDFLPQPEWISNKLRGLVTPAQAEKAIAILVHLGLWKPDGKGGIAVCDTVIVTGDESVSFGQIKVSDIHKDNLVAWGKIFDQIPSVERELGLLTIPINAAKMPEFKKRIQRFQDEIIGWLQDEKEPTQLVQLGTYLVPVTKK